MIDGISDLAILNRIGAIIDADIDMPVTMFVTSSHFARIYAEMLPLVAGPVKPNPVNFKQLMVGRNLVVVNSGSEDQIACNLANQLEAERANFRWRHDNLRTG